MLLKIHEALISSSKWESPSLSLLAQRLKLPQLEPSNERVLSSKNKVIFINGTLPQYPFHGPNFDL